MKIKKLLLAIVAFAVVVPVFGANEKLKFVEASDLNIIGHISEVQNPYSRVDTTKYKGFTKWQNYQIRCSSGLAVVFKTDSPIITVKTEYGGLYTGVTTNVLAHKGYDLYIRDNGEWIYAQGAVESHGKPGSNVTIINHMDGTMHECLLYLPLYSEERSIKIGVAENSTIEAMESPFRHKVGIYGSSYTHGICCARAGMTYPAQFTRRTGIQLLSLGMSGQCKMQPYAAEVLADADVDAFIFDTFSNPSPKEIRQRLFPFIEKLQKAHPGIPLIFQRTIYREQRNFDTKCQADESYRIQVADSMMAIACNKYKDVYYIHPNASAKDHETSIDGIHPSDYGYLLWERSIEKKVLRILKKYGLK